MISMAKKYVADLTVFRAQDARKTGAFLETDSLHPPLAALRLFPFLGLSPRQEPPCGGCAPKRACGRSPAHTLHPQGVCSIRKAAQPLTAALPYLRGEFTTLSTVTHPRSTMYSGDVSIQCSINSPGSAFSAGCGGAGSGSTGGSRSKSAVRSPAPPR